MKTGEQFKKQAALHSITEWRIHDCSICGYPCGYIMPLAGENAGRVGYDSGCDCVSYLTPIRLRSWDDIAEHYNMQTSDAARKEMDDFWRFSPQEIPHQHPINP